MIVFLAIFAVLISSVIPSLDQKVSDLTTAMMLLSFSLTIVLVVIAKK